MDCNRAGSLTCMISGKVGDSSMEGFDPEQSSSSIGSISIRSECDEFNGHRLLRGGRPPFMNKLSPRQMDSVTAVCNTLLPSIRFSSGGDESLRAFYATSASMAGTPEHLGGSLSGKLKHVALALLRLALWFLSTWYGTFIMCGTLSLSRSFPYFQSFSKVEQHKREQILLSWSMSSFYLYRQLFKGIKFLTLLIFFTQVDAENKNPSWKALGYCGPDPEFINQRKRASPYKEGRYGPLYRTVLDLGNSRDYISDKLKKSGFPAPVIRKCGNAVGSKMASLFTLHCDAVVVGSGSGGGVVAGVLAKAGYKVLVLEKGNYYARNKLSLLEGPSMDNMYEGNGLLATDDLGVVILAGSTVGGGSAINWSASIRTPPHVLREWSDEYGLELFNSKAYAQAMDVVCERMGVQSQVEEDGFNNSVLRKGCLELGYPVNDIPRNSSSDHYCGWCCFGCKDGAKKGTHETWLVDMANSGNGLILAGCKALQVLHHKRRMGGRPVADGVLFQFEEDGELYRIQSKVTVVSCGALGTPVLLQKSGLKNPHVGKHLHLHPVVMAWGYFPEQRWPKKDKKSYEGGIMTSMSTIVGNFHRFDGYGAIIQTPSLHPGMFSALMPWVSSLDFKERMCRYSRTAHIFALARDKGSGVIQGGSTINSLRYELGESDEKHLNQGLEKVLRILAAAGAEEIGTHHCKGDRLNVKKASSHQFERFVREVSGRPLRDLSTPICSAHQMGSCRMGVDPTKSVVNERGEVWEVEGLFVADTSVFPTALGVNPMVTVQAMAYCTAQAVVDLLHRKKTSNY